MLNLNYYFVDVGENYCFISERNCLISLKEAFFENNSTELKLAREVLVHTFKKKCVFSSDEEFKMVFVNKVGKMFIESQVEDCATKAEIEPLISTKKYDIYKMTPGQRLDIQCQVVVNEQENRNLNYDSIVPTKKAKKFSKKY